MVINVGPDLEPPRFVGEMSDVPVEEGGRARFECRVQGVPEPDVRWLALLRWSGHLVEKRES